MVELISNHLDPYVMWVLWRAGFQVQEVGTVARNPEHVQASRRLAPQGLMCAVPISILQICFEF